MFNTKLIKPSVDAMSMMIWRDRICMTGTYYTVKPTTSNMDDSYANVL